MSIRAVPSKTDLWTVESVGPVAVATGEFGLYLSLNLKALR